jgi:hypothetical protein
VGLFSDFIGREAKTDRVDLPAVLTDRLAETIVRAAAGGIEAALLLAPPASDALGHHPRCPGTGSRVSPRTRHGRGIGNMG